MRGNGINGVTIKHLYNRLVDVDNGGDKEFWRSIWNIKVPKRIKSFVRLLGHDSLPTNQKSMKGMEGVDYKLCGCVCETTLHVFRDFPRARQLWSTNVPTNVELDFFALNIKGWITLNLAQMGQRSSFWVVGCDSLWWWRNKELHDYQFIRLYSPSNYVWIRIEDFDNAQAGISDIMNNEISLIEV